MILNPIQVLSDTELLEIRKLLYSLENISSPWGFSGYGTDLQNEFQENEAQSSIIEAFMELENHLKNWVAVRNNKIWLQNIFMLMETDDFLQRCSQGFQDLLLEYITQIPQITYSFIQEYTFKHPIFLGMVKETLLLEETEKSLQILQELTSQDT